VAGGPELHVRKGHGCGGHLHLPCLADGNAGDFVPILPFHPVDQVIVAKPFQAVVRDDGYAVLVDEYPVEIAIPGLSLQDDRGIAEPGQNLGGLAARVGLLDPPGERTLAAHGDAAGHGREGAAQHPRSDDKLVVFT
jgi:hypothetical protein